MRKKVDGRVRALIEAGVASGHRSLLVVVGDGGREQVCNLHYMLSKAQVKARPNVLWCYKKELGFSSHRKKRMSQIKKRAGKAKLSAAATDEDGGAGAGGADPFELFISSTEITYAYYKDSARVLGRTFGMAVLQDFEALTPNVLARAVETVCGGGLIVLLLGKLSSLQQLHDLAMDAHARLRTPSSGAVVPRFNGRFLLSLADCPSCLLLDDELNVLPLSAHAHALQPTGGVAATPAHSAPAAKAKAAAAAELAETVRSLADVPIAGTLLPLCKSADQAKALLTVADALADKSLRQTVAITAARGRGKSAALGLALAAAIGNGYANIFVTAPSVENVQTVFEFALKGLDALAYSEHADYSVREALPLNEKAPFDDDGRGGGGGGELGGEGVGEGEGARGKGLRCVSRIDVFRSHRQTIIYVRPDDGAAVRHAEMVVVDEAAAIPLPLVRQLLGPWLCVLSSTVSGYEGTGRALSLKLIKGLRDKAAPTAGQHGAAAVAAGGCADGGASGGRSLREVGLSEPIRYSEGDPVEAWLHALLCLDASSAVRPVLACPHPSACELYLVERDALFSYHRASEAFLQRVVGLCVSSHYKNSPNDLLLLADAPAHALFVLVGPTLPLAGGEARLPDVLAVVQLAYEGRLGRALLKEGQGRGLQPAGDLLPWTVSQQFQDPDFAALSGARIVRIATHPDLQRMGYGSRALELLAAFFKAQLPADRAPQQPQQPPPPLHAALGEPLAPRPAASLPPLLRRLSEVALPAGGLDYLGTSFGCAYPLLQFWRKAGFAPVYLRQQPNDTTGEHSILMLADLSDGRGGSDWLHAFHCDWSRRFMQLSAAPQLRRALDIYSALALLQPAHAQPKAQAAGSGRADGSGGGGGECSLSVEQLGVLLSPYDVQRLRAYARSMADHHLISDLTPTLAALCLGPEPQVRVQLSVAQQAILLALGLRRQSADEAAAALQLPVSQLLALFAKAVRKLAAALSAVHEKEAAKALPRAGASAQAAARLRPLAASSLAAELHQGGQQQLHAMRAHAAADAHADDGPLVNEQAGAAAAAAALAASGELAQFAIRGSEDEWASALHAAAAGKPSSVRLKADRPREAGPGDDEGGGHGGGGSAHKRYKHNKHGRGGHGRGLGGDGHGTGGYGGGRGKHHH